MNFVHYKKFVGLHLFMMVLELGMNLKFIWYCTDVFEIAVVENGYWKCDQKIAKYWFIWMFVWFKSWHLRTSVCWICLFWYHQVQYFEFISSAQLCYILHKNAKENYRHMYSHNKASHSVKYVGSIDAIGSVNAVHEDWIFFNGLIK